MSNNKQLIYKALGILFISLLIGLFTYLLVKDYISDVSFTTLITVTLLCLIAVLSFERLKEVSLGKFGLKLFQSFEFDAFAKSTVDILIKLSTHTNGSAIERKEREKMIDDLLVSLKVNQEVRQMMLADTKLITRLMSTDDETKLSKIREEIEQRGLFD